MGKHTISSQELADYTHVNSTQIRRDLSGLRQVRQARRRLQRRLAGLADPQDPAHRRPAQHRAVRRRPPRPGDRRVATSSPTTASAIVAIFDTDERKIGEQIGELTRAALRRAQRAVGDEEIVVGVLAVPGEAAQSVADDLVEAGVKIIFNYSEALLQTPPHVTVHTSSPAVDLLYALYFYLQ